MSVSAFDIYSAAARRIGKLPKEWQAVIFTKVVGGILCTGAVSPPYVRGPRKGEPNWPKRDRSTEATVVVSHAAYDAMKRKHATPPASSTTGASDV